MCEVLLFRVTPHHQLDQQSCQGRVWYLQSEPLTAGFIDASYFPRFTIFISSLHYSQGEFSISRVRDSIGSRNEIVFYVYIRVCNVLSFIGFTDDMSTTIRECLVVLAFIGTLLFTRRLESSPQTFIVIFVFSFTKRTDH